jgi:hypothetical protein
VRRSEVAERVQQARLNSDGLYSYCKDCVAAYDAARYKNNPDKAKAKATAWYAKPENKAKKRAYDRRLTYGGLSRGMFHAIVHARGGGCWYCGTTHDLEVDHCHQAEFAGMPLLECVRGVVCGRHNTKQARVENGKRAATEAEARYFREWPAQRVIQRHLRDRRHRAAA